MSDIVDKIQRGLKKPPKVIINRVVDEIKLHLGQFYFPYKAKQFDLNKLLRETQTSTIEHLWDKISRNKYFSNTDFRSITDYENQCPNDYERILKSAKRALNNEVNLLGTGYINLGEKIDWHKDYKTNIRWKSQYISKISYSTSSNLSDVKIPWEISRLQWLIPLGQAYLLNKDEKYPTKVKEILTDWISENPYAQSVNWACTMEVALRIFTWTWFFHVFKNSKAWEDTEFRSLFLRSLYMHGDFTEKFIEKSDINGNHFTADAAGLVIVGVFFGEGKKTTRWIKNGWLFLEDELPKQVFEDGVDYEASIAYHRLVLELFLLPAYYRQLNGHTVSDFYKNRLIAMANFTEAYSRPNGTIPFWGDADDARALPFRDDEINDHRYLLALVGFAFNNLDLINKFSGNKVELYWFFESKLVHTLNENNYSRKSKSFKDGGFYVLRDDRNHVFVDSGPLGLAGRGGHGHNDLLAFELVLKGEQLISDCGSYLYTANYQERNNFRSTAYHNTPQIDGEEINRFIRWDYLWNLHNDAHPEVILWDQNEEKTILICSHNGYKRLADPVKISRGITLFHKTNSFIIEDVFISEDVHLFEIPIHLSLDVSIVVMRGNKIILMKNDNYFELQWHSDIIWDVLIEDARISQSYGVVHKTNKIKWVFKGKSQRLTLKIIISPIPNVA
jgi:uncharacterized heparinase superfamily protein